MKKVISIILATVLCAALFAGCSTTSKKSGVSGKTQTTTSASEKAPAGQSGKAKTPAKSSADQSAKAKTPAKTPKNESEKAKVPSKNTKAPAASSQTPAPAKTPAKAAK
ncbi:MAG: hypothetical protein VB082_02345 [Christensenella sp.]|nr:hypothetical protein [Christensenella sp.]